MSDHVAEATQAAAVIGPVDPDVLDEVAPVPTLRSLLLRERTRVIWDGAIPIALFIGVNSTVGLPAAIAVTTAYSLGLSLFRARRGQRTNWLTWVVLAFVAIRGIVSALFNSKVLYFGPQLVNEALIGLAFAVSVAVRRPLTAYVGQWVYPFHATIKEHPVFRRVFNRITLVWAVYLIAGAAVKMLLLLNTSSNTYVLVRPVISWPPMIALFVFSLRYPRRVFKRVPELAPLVERAEALRTRRA